MMTNLKEELTNSLSDLIVFLSDYKGKINVNNFIGILEEMQFILQSIGHPQIPAETMIHLQKRYKSMFFQEMVYRIFMFLTRTLHT